MAMRATLQSETLDAIGMRIISGHYREGQVLRAEDLETDYQVSRTVVREVLKVLESMHLIVMRRKVGITIRPRSAWQVFDPRVIRWRLAGPDRAAQLQSLTSLRIAVEPEAAKRAAIAATPRERIELLAAATRLSEAGIPQVDENYLQQDIQFHTLLLQASGNEMFAALSQSVAEVMTGRSVHGLSPTSPSRESLTLHVQIARAIAEGRADEAEARSRELLSAVAEQLSDAALSDEGGGSGEMSAKGNGK